MSGRDVSGGKGYPRTSGGCLASFPVDAAVTKEVRVKIAAYVDDSGAAVGFYEKGQVCLYEQVSGAWEITKKIPLEINIEMSLLEIKELFFSAMSQLEDCKVFIVREFKGLFHALLIEELGFHTWKSEGTMLEQLDNVVLQEKEYVAELEKQALANADKPKVRVAGSGGCGGGCSPSRVAAMGGQDSGACESACEVPLPVLTGDIADGCYSINLAAILEENPTLNSRQILMPALEETSFKKLEIICDHLPRWFNNELRNLKLTAGPEVPDETGKWLKVVVTRK